MEDEEDYHRRKKKGKGFWNIQRIAFVIVFLVGIVFGAIVINQFIDPVLDNGVSNENQELQTINEELDALNDSYYSCLQTFEIDPLSCSK